MSQSLLQYQLLLARQIVRDILTTDRKQAELRAFAKPGANDPHTAALAFAVARIDSADAPCFALPTCKLSLDEGHLGHGEILLLENSLLSQKFNLFRVAIMVPLAGPIWDLHLRLNRLALDVPEQRLSTLGAIPGAQTKKPTEVGLYIKY